MKRLIKIFLPLIVLSLIITGCGKKVQQGKKLIVWHWMTDRQEAFEELAKKYKELTGVTVEFQLYAPSEVYSAKVRAAAYTKTLPDIYGILGETRDFANFIKANLVENLTPYMGENNGEWKSWFFEKALSVNEFKEDNEFGIKPGIYGVPIDVTNIQILYNKKLFQKAGLDPENPPQTWEEFIEAAKKLKSIGVDVLIGGFGETWMLDCLANNFAWNIMGKEKILATIRGEVPYTDSDWIKIFELFEQMHKEGIIPKGAVTMVNKIAEQNFANERVAMALNGSWCVNVYYGMNPDLEYGAMLPPRVSDKYPRRIWGGAGSSFVVNGKSLVKEGAVKFLKWLTDVPQQVYLSKKTKNLPANKKSLTEIPPILAQFADDMDKTVHPRELPVNEFSIVVETFDRGLQSILIGEKTPLEVAREVQKIKERELKRAQRK